MTVLVYYVNNDKPIDRFYYKLKLIEDDEIFLNKRRQLWNKYTAFNNGFTKIYFTLFFKYGPYNDIKKNILYY